MKLFVLSLGALLACGSAFADDEASQVRLMGKWQQTDGNGQNKSEWNLQSSGTSIHVMNSTGKDTLAAFDCNTMGKECDIKDAGKRSKVSLWFNGAKLVEMETRGSQVVKRRFSVTGNGDTMEVETIPIVPVGKEETEHFKRML